MKKAILVIDMPKNCSRCELHAFYQERASCKPNIWCPVGADIEDKYLVGNGRPDWCPLGPVPEKELIYHLDEDWDGMPV